MRKSLQINIGEKRSVLNAKRERIKKQIKNAVIRLSER